MNTEQLGSDGLGSLEEKQPGSLVCFTYNWTGLGVYAIQLKKELGLANHDRSSLLGEWYSGCKHGVGGVPYMLSTFALGFGIPLSLWARGKKAFPLSQGRGVFDNTFSRRTCLDPYTHTHTHYERDTKQYWILQVSLCNKIRVCKGCWLFVDTQGDRLSYGQPMVVICFCCRWETRPLQIRGVPTNHQPPFFKCHQWGCFPFVPPPSWHCWILLQAFSAVPMALVPETPESSPQSP